ncbi:hypothetical protein GCM10009678_93480 [Actinomadura kijaniata]
MRTLAVYTEDLRTGAPFRRIPAAVSSFNTYDGGVRSRGATAHHNGTRHTKAAPTLGGRARIAMVVRVGT